MVILLAALVLGGLAWMWQRNRSNGTSARLPDVLLRSPARPSGGRPIPAGQLADGRIVVSGLTRQYQDVKAVDDLSFVVEPGGSPGSSAQRRREARYGTVTFIAARPWLLDPAAD